MQTGCAGGQGLLSLRRSRLAQQCETTSGFAPTASGPDGKAGFSIGFRDHDGRHLLHETIDACPAPARQPFETSMLVVRQTKGKSAHSICSLRNCSGVTTESWGNFSSILATCRIFRVMIWVAPPANASSIR